jgi:hypothetical protein
MRWAARGRARAREGRKQEPVMAQGPIAGSASAIPPVLMLPVPIK